MNFGQLTIQILGIWSTGNIAVEAPTTIKSDNSINNIDNNNSINDIDSSKSLRQPYTCDSILGDSLCPLEKIHKTVEVEGMAIHYWIYQVLKQSSLIDSRR